MAESYTAHTRQGVRGTFLYQSLGDVPIHFIGSMFWIAATSPSEICSRCTLPEPSILSNRTVLGTIHGICFQGVGSLIRR